MRKSSSETSPIRPCHAAPAFDTTISTPPKRSQTALNAARTCSGLVTSQSSPKPFTAAAALFAASPSMSTNGDRRAVGGERLGGRGADRAGARHERNLPGERLDHRAFQLRLLEAPIFEREQIALGQRLVAADGLGVGDDLDRVLGEVGGDRGVLRRAAQAEQADARHQHDARAAVELGFDPADGGILAGEIGIVFGDEFRHGLAHGGGKVVEFAGLRRRHDQRPVLGADDVVGRHHAALAVRGELGPVDIGQDFGAGAEVGDEARGLGALMLDGGSRRE